MNEVPDPRTQAADDRDRVADERDVLADRRDELAAQREAAANEAERALADMAPSSAQAILDALVANAFSRARNDDDDLAQRDRARVARSPRDADWELEKRDFVADDRQHQADLRELIADERERLAALREDILRDLAVAVALDTGGVGSPLPLASEDRDGREQARRAREEAEAARQRADQDLALTRRSAFAADLVAVARALVHADTIDGALEEIVAAATRTIGGCDAATFSMVTPNGAASTAAASDGTGPGFEFDLAQYAAGQGPSLDAIAKQAVITSADVRADSRWPELATRVTDTPWCAVLCVPVIDERRNVVLGSLNHYSRVGDGFADVDAECAVLLAAHLGAVLALALDAAAAGRRVIELGQAVQSRDVIGQAKGILMERQRLTADKAFDVLRRASQRLNRKLVEVADELARTGTITAPRS